MDKKNVFLYFFFAFWCCIVSCSSFKLVSYLKPKTDKPIVYRYSFPMSSGGIDRNNDSTKGEHQKDSIELFKGEMAVLFKTIQVDGRKVFFVIETEDTSSSNPSIGPTYFLNSALLFSGDSILLASIYRKSDLLKLKKEDFNQFIPPKVSSSDTITIMDHTVSYGRKKILLYNFHQETLNIGGVRVKKCLAVNTLLILPQSRSYGKIWLHKHYGVVKWTRSTGRIEEIKF